MVWKGSRSWAAVSSKVPALPPPDVSRVRPGEQVVLERALHLEPQLRWPSCTGLMDALQYAASHPDLDRPAAGSWCRNQPGTGRYKVARPAVT